MKKYNNIEIDTRGTLLFNTYLGVFTYTPWRILECKNNLQILAKNASKVKSVIYEEV